MGLARGSDPSLTLINDSTNKCEKATEPSAVTARGGSQSTRSVSGTQLRAAGAAWQRS